MIKFACGFCFFYLKFTVVRVNIYIIHKQEVKYMGKRIIVAGLGHGGIAAAALLAKSGYDVTVFEKKEQGTLGYDWTDIFAPAALGIAGIPMPPRSKYEFKENMTFFSPNTVRGLEQQVPHDELEIKMERKDIYDHLINHAVSCGVKIEYGCEVISPIVKSKRVIGINTSDGEKYADLIIDACGMNSPVRRNLPDELGIENEIARRERITIFRAFYNKATDEEVDAKFRVMLLEGGRLGVSWVASEEEHTDLLVGRFEDFDLDEVNSFADYLRTKCPRLGKEIVRGGQFVEIPVRHPLSVMVADGYAAIGDSAFMTVPLIGSGIANSLKAAKMLADTVIADKEDTYSAEKLWNYQVKYYRALGAGLAPLECVKFLLLSLEPEELDYCFNSGMLNEDNITMTANFTALTDLFKLDIPDLMNKGIQVIQYPTLLKKILGCGVSIAKVTAACAAMPRVWNEQAVKLWADMYTKSFK